MAVIFNEKNVSFEQRHSPVPEFAWHTSRKLAEMAGAKQLLFEIRSQIYMAEERVDYYRGEENVAEKWK
jgi:hypothetical protein